ncbi:MAG: hypothetical protein KC503_02355 [Myxococcales bacterium]|nr:hypothetical protein [Myxococcales bacterium]
MPRRHRRLSLLLLLALALEATSARADWTGDEAHRDKLRKRLATLKTAIAAYERDRRQMDMIRASVAAMKLPFADPAFDPAKLVRRVLPRRFVGVEVVSATAKRLKGGDATLERWRVRCTLRGDYGTLLHVVAVLPRYGLFVEPPLSVSPGAPSTVELSGLHVRLDLKSSNAAASASDGPDAYATRTDELARDIRKLRGEIEKLKRRVADIRSFEAHLKAVERFIAVHRDGLSPRRLRPLRRLRAALRLDALQITRAELVDARSVKLSGVARSPAAARAARRYAKKRRWLTLELGQAPADSAHALDPKRLHALGASALDVGVYSGARVVAALEPRGAKLLSRSLSRARRGALEAQAMAKALGLALRRRRQWALLAPKLSSRALARVRGRGRPVRLALWRKPIAHALSFLAQGRRALYVERALLSRDALLTLSGRERRSRWLALAAAALGSKLRRERQRFVIGDPDTAIAIEPRAAREDDAVKRTREQRRRRRRRRRPRGRVHIPLSAYKLRILARGRAVARSGGTATLLRRGRRISRSRVRKVDAEGVLLRHGRATFRWR